MSLKPLPENVLPIIRWAVSVDAATIVDFNCRLAAETEGKSLDRQRITAGVAAIFENNVDARYIVATVGDAVVGQLMLTREWSDWRNGWFYWIQSVYVDAPFRRRGIFRQLCQFAINWCRSQADVVGLRLYVERDNTKAAETYDRLGLMETGYLVRELPLRHAIPTSATALPTTDPTPG